MNCRWLWLTIVFAIFLLIPSLKVYAINEAFLNSTVFVTFSVKPGETVAFRFLGVPVLGPDGKYLPIVRLHLEKGIDVAAINITEGSGMSIIYK